MPQVGTNQSDPETYFNNTDPTIYALDGDDVIRFAGALIPPDPFGRTFAPGYFEGGRGNDTIFSGPGWDTVYGGDGNDIIDGGLGVNFLDGGNGDDVIYVRGTRVINSLDLGLGDTVYGGEGHDTIYALGTATHNIYGGFGNDTIYGNEVIGSAGRLDGGDGNDIIYGGRGNVVDGGNGADIIYGQRASVLRGGGGDDMYEITTTEQLILESGSTSPFILPDFDTVFAYVDFSLPINFEKLVMIYGSQTYGYGNDQANQIFGNASANVIEGRGGYDTLTGGAGSDLFLINPNWGVDVITDFVAGTGTPDAVIFSRSVFASYEQVIANARQVGADTWIGDGGLNTVVLQNVTLASLHQNDFGFI